MLTGCFAPHIRTVNQTITAKNVMNATLAQLETSVTNEYSSVQTINASVDITATTGGEHEGQVKENPTLSGYIFLRKPQDLHVLLLVPVLRSRAIDMVSDGKEFKLLIPSKNRAVVGADELTTPSKNGLENLRPNIIRDALLIAPMQSDEFVTLTEGTHVLVPTTGRKVSVEEPDYDVTILRTKQDHELERVRVIHIGRVTLRPYQQDIYDHQGRIVTTVVYDKFQKFGETDFPTSILITRPLDEYTLKMEFTKVVLNGKLDDEQFQLKIPEGVAIQKM